MISELNYFMIYVERFRAISHVAGRESICLFNFFASTAAVQWASRGERSK